MGNAEPVERGAAETEDVDRLVGEDVARILAAGGSAADGAGGGPVRDAAAVRVEQAAKERAGVPLDDVLLPALQHDPAGVLLPYAVLGKEAHPVLGVGLDLHTTRA